MREIAGTLLVTVDAEQDISKYLSNSFVGVTEGVPALLDTFTSLGISATFFVQGLVCDRYPEVVREIRDKGHAMGCHGYQHVPYGERTRWGVERDIAAAVTAVQRVSRERPWMFRAAEFSLTSNLVHGLERNGFRLDSSALRNYPRSFLFGLAKKPLRNVPDKPYILSNATQPRGHGTILEVPVTESPQVPGAPLGCGFLHRYGVEPTISSLRRVTSAYSTFLIHPWEVVDLPALPGLPPWVRSIARRDNEALRELVGRAKDFMTVADFPSFLSELSGSTWSSALDGEASRQGA